ncbi:YHS domain-containing protein (plasmid) [Photobacterium sp. GJ3]|uniref:YHS domain-containing (seleno)protein n=1 Tax=Photobacterium sp. GJ3 TaxID=2829502 RepID=UPI001B8C9A34|nr:YHS domain-containing (seleno)protein [Photobacterium sp. GJ3]QUJ69515.1 YHS domain-containing protein [Photobacterium sp. GJ3]
MRRLLILLLLAFSPFFTSSAFAKEDPIYTSFFSDKALSGYDTVAYFTQGKAVEGQSQYQTRYMDADWYFSSQAHLDAFLADPEKYAPQYGGYCAWALGAKNTLAPGNPKHWTVHQGKLYLNYDASVRKQWLADRDALIQLADQRWPAVLN